MSDCPVDWTNYPETLASEDSAKWYDLPEQNAGIRLMSRDLFVEGGEGFFIKVFDYSVQAMVALGREKVFRSETEFLAYLDENPRSFECRVFLIRQQGSWGALTITQPAARKLLSLLKCSPAIINMLKAFGRKTNPVGDSHSQFLNQILEGCAQETSYIFKHCEEHGRAETDGKWSVRQIGVYCRVAPSNAQTNMIIINPSDLLHKQLKRFLLTKTEPSLGALHRAVLSSSVERWRWYVDDIEAQCLEMKTKAQLTYVDGKGIQENSFGASIHFEDIQDIQVLQDECYQILHFLDLDGTVLRRLKESAEEEEYLQNLATVLEMEQKRVHSILQRLNATITLTRTILDFQSLASLRANSSVMKDLAEASSSESRMMTDLAKKTSKDTDVVRTLTLIALTYLPASFVSSMMGMDYIHVQDPHSNISIVFQGEFWIFLVLTILLLILTFAGYRLKVRRSGEVTTVAIGSHH